jgi:hypothetical protein
MAPRDRPGKAAQYAGATALPAVVTMPHGGDRGQRQAMFSRPLASGLASSTLCDVDVIMRSPRILAIGAFTLLIISLQHTRWRLEPIGVALHGLMRREAERGSTCRKEFRI